MTKWITDRRNMMVIVSLGLFNFIFLGIEFLFDNCLAEIGVASAEVVTAQNLVLGISVLGYLLYPCISDKVSKKLYAFPIIAFAIVLTCVYLIQIGTTYETIFAAGAICFFVLGYFGNAVCFLATQVITDFHYLARAAGISYAFGVLLQFIHTNWMKGTFAKQTMLVIGCIVFCGLLIWGKGKTETSIQTLYKEQREGFELRKPVLAGILLIFSVALMTCLFSTLDNAVTLVHSSGDFNIGQWPRLILALSGLVAGFVYDLHNRKYMGTMMYSISFLATIAIVILACNGPFIIGLIMFYISAGFFVVFFMASFMDISVHSSKPKLWAGLGRAVNNLCAVATTAISVALLSSTCLVIMIVAIVILGLISVALLVYGIMVNWDSRKEEPVTEAGEKDVAVFAKEFGLTEREEELLRIFLESEDAVQDVAAQMAISRAALYRHIQALNEKTGTKTRVGIVQCFYNWSNKN